MQNSWMRRDPGCGELTAAGHFFVRDLSHVGIWVSVGVLELVTHEYQRNNCIESFQLGILSTRTWNVLMNFEHFQAYSQHFGIPNALSQPAFYPLTSKGNVIPYYDFYILS